MNRAIGMLGFLLLIISLFWHTLKYIFEIKIELSCIIDLNYFNLFFTSCYIVSRYYSKSSVHYVNSLQWGFGTRKFTYTISTCGLFHFYPDCCQIWLFLQLDYTICHQLLVQFSLKNHQIWQIRTISGRAWALARTHHYTYAIM